MAAALFIGFSPSSLLESLPLSSDAVSVFHSGIESALAPEMVALCGLRFSALKLVGCRFAFLADR
jgi:hypothetical protein